MKKTNRLKIYLLSLLFVVFIFSSCTKKQPSTSFTDHYLRVESTIPVSENITSSETLCYDFIKNKLTSPQGGIYTNLKDTSKTADLAQGHEILSESMGLLLEFAILRKDPVLYNNTSRYIFENMVVDDILLWRIDEDIPPITDVSATIDDLRIYQALLDGKALWPQTDTEVKLLQSIETQLVNKGFNDGYLVSYYSSAKTPWNSLVELPYLNLVALDDLAKSYPDLSKNRDLNKTLLFESYIGDSFPMYHKTYNVKTQSYESPEDKINILDSLMSMLNLAKAGYYHPDSLQWLLDKLDYGELYTYYNIHTGEALTHDTSAAAYGISAQIGSALENEDLLNSALYQLKKIQNKDPQSSIYGGFGYNDNAYSYDNLHGLLGLIYEK